MKLSKSLFAALSSLCLLNACGDWTSFTANDCSQDEGAKIFDNAYYICDEFNHWKQIIPKCKPGETRFVETKDGSCIQQECTNLLSWPSTSNIPTPNDGSNRSCVRQNGSFTQIGECLNGKSSCDEEGAKTDTPYRICSNGQRFEFGVCGCDSTTDSSCSNVNESTGVTCIDGMLKTCTQKDTNEIVSCNESTGQCGECLNDDIRCDGNQLKICKDGKWDPIDDDENKCPCIPGESRCSNKDYNAVQICNDKGEWEPQFCEADQTCGNKDNTKDNTCIPKNEFKCKDNQNCYNLDPSKPICDTNSGQCVPCNGDNCKAIDENKPFCNSSTNQCVECNDNINCNDSSKPVCNTNSNQCVTCSDDNCKAIDETKPICNTESRQCVECNDNINCNDSSKPVCNTNSNQCVPCNGDNCKQDKPECSNNDDCTDPSKSICNESGQCVECITRNNCQPSNEYITKICENEKCTECNAQKVGHIYYDDTTKTGYTCILVVHDAQQYQWQEYHVCTEDNDCTASTPVCDKKTGRCVECVEKANCKDPSKPVCDIKSGQCVECTTSDNHCPNALACNTSTNKCIVCRKSDFNNNIQCPEGTICDDNSKCSTTTIECQTYEECINKDITKPVCNKDGQCVPCDNNHQCPGEGHQNVCDGGQCIECNLNNKNDTRCIWDKGIQYICEQNSNTKAYEWRELANNTDSSFQRQCQCEDDDQCKLLGDFVCATNTGKCVECNSNADCPGENPICFENTCKKNNSFYCKDKTIAYFQFENNGDYITQPPCDDCKKNRDNSFYCSNPEDICNPSSNTKPDPRKPCIKCSGNEVIPTLCKSNEVCRYTDTDGNKCLPYCETNQTCIADHPYSICVDDICQEISDSITLPPPEVCDSNSSEIQSYCVNNPMTGQTDIAVCSNKKYKQYSCGPGRTCKDGKCIEKCDEPESVQCFYDNKASNSYTVNTTSYMQFNACNSTTVKEGHSMWNNYIYPLSDYNNQTELCINNSLNIEIDELKSNAISTHCSLPITTDSNSSTIYINGKDIKCDGSSLCYMGKCLNIMDTKTTYPSTSCVECKRPTSDPTIHDTILDRIPTIGLNPTHLNNDKFWCGETDYRNRILIQTSNEKLLLFCPEGQTCRGGECK